jgi:glycosyltransferase involved in cell wall biosynthesis
MNARLPSMLDTLRDRFARLSSRAADPRTAGGVRASGPRVLMVVESAAGGTGRHVLDLCVGLLARGGDVHLIYSTGRVDRAFLRRLAGLTDLPRMALPMRTGPHPADLTAVRAIRRYASEHGPFDVIHGHSSKGGALARLAAIGTDARAFYTLHGLIMMDPGLAHWKRLFYLGVELILSLRTSRVIAVSPEEARAAVRVGLGRSRVVTVPNGVGPGALAPRGEARRLMGVPDDAVVIGFVGRLVEQKAPDVLLRAFAQAAGAEPRARLALVGSGPLEQSLRDLADRLGITRNVVWLGERDARGVLAGFDVFAIASRKEGLPYVVLEAMSAGLPVVATASSGIEILVRTGTNGIVVPTGDAAAFGRALATLATRPPLLARYGRASADVAAGLTIDRMVDRTSAEYVRAGRRKPVGPPAPRTASVTRPGPATASGMSDERPAFPGVPQLIN